MKPTDKPARPFFSSGPCAKYPGWAMADLTGACLSRSHRSSPGKAKLFEAINRTRALLKVPDDYEIAIVPGSDTGAMELLMWSLLGPRGVDMLVWESFGADWLYDLRHQLKLDDLRDLKADYGALPDLAQVDSERDMVFLWSGTTSGVRVPDGDWIADQRGGLTLCDATSAVFAMDLPWKKLDAVTFSWQKAMGGEAAHGMVVLSPRALRRLKSYSPPWPMPKVFRLTSSDGEPLAGLFSGATINTPSLLCVEDYIRALQWGDSLGGLEALIARSQRNLAVVSEWVARTKWVEFLAADPAIRASTAICLKITDPAFSALDDKAQRKLIKKISAQLEAEDVAYDIAGHRNASPGLRIWGGATIDESDIKALLPWLDWAFGECI